MQKLLIISIGPVQDFIATARRSRDLYFGSWMLSELSKSVAKKMADTFGLESLIFPAPEQMADLDANSDFNVANRILLITKQVISSGEIDELIHQALKQRLDEIREEAFGRISGKFNQQIAAAQVDDLVECYWADAPLQDERNYVPVRKGLDALLAARKNTREFQQPSWGSHQPKSSLDGQRESVLDESIFDNLTPVQLYEQYGVRPGERLSGVGLLKRHGSRGQNVRFFSTSHVAALPYLAGLDASHKEAVDVYVKALQKLGLDDESLGNVPGKPHPAFGRYDGHVLYPGRLAEFFSDDDLSTATFALETFFLSVDRRRHPQPYYALLVGDGDHMGKMLNAQKLPEAHRRFSKTLARFAGIAKKIVREYDGSPVYAGGDDVLAFLPVHRALDCARALARAFTNLMNIEGQESPTFSVGIAINHHLEPLADALELARDAEHTAKTLRPQKNALAISVAKRSGSTTTVVGPWGMLDKRLDLFTRLHRQEAIPDKIGYELRDLARRLGIDSHNPENTALTEIVLLEALRLLGRKRAERGKVEVDKALQHCLHCLMKTADAGVAGIADELIVARLFAEVKDLAGMAEDEDALAVCSDPNLKEACKDE